jgi:hypothetical protein
LLLVGGAVLMMATTSCAITSPSDGIGVDGVATVDAMDPCAGARSTNTPGAGTPDAVALANFLTWSQFPAREGRARTIINDGSFARVVVCAQVRHGLNDAWDEFSGEYALSFTRGQWTVQKSPRDRMDGFVSVKGEATRQAAEQAATEKLHAALAARQAIRATVAGITEVRDIPADSSYSKVTLERQSTDDKQHVVSFWPNFRATMRQCATTSLEGTESIMSISGLFGSQPKETIGPIPIQRDYAFKAAQNPWHGVFARADCQILTDPRDLRLTIDQIDGFEAFSLDSAERPLATATETPSQSPTVVTVAPEVVPSPTIIAHATPAPATTTGGASGAGLSAIVLSLGAAVIGIIVVWRAVFGWPLAIIRPFGRPEHIGELAGKDRPSRAEEAHPLAANPVDSNLELAFDGGHLVATPASVTGWTRWRHP